MKAKHAGTDRPKASAFGSPRRVRRGGGTAWAFGGRMIAEYGYTYTEHLMIEGLRRFRRRHHQRYWLPVLKVIGFVGLVAFLAFSVYADLVVPGVTFFIFLLLLLTGPRLDYFILKRRHRKSPFFNSNVTVQLGEQGCTVQDANSKSELSWAMFTGGHRFRDGFLVLHGPQQYQWWPDSALVKGSVADVDALLRRHVPGYEAAEQNAAGDARDARA